MATDKQLFSIVVVGAMNPRIHHPFWYRYVDLLSKEEAEEATENPETFCVPLLAQLQTQSLKIVCQEDRWEVQAAKPDLLQRLQDMTAKVFDDLLYHTPVKRFGFNFDYQRQTKHDNVPGFLADCLGKTPMGLNRENATAAELVYRRSYEDRLVSVAVRPLPDKQRVLVANNYEYPLRGEGFFKMGDRFSQRYYTDRADAEEQTRLIVESIDIFVR